MLTRDLIRKRAFALGADLCGIGDIALFEGSPIQRNPKCILPNATCIIGFGFRVPKALYDQMGRGIQYYNYTSMGVKYIDEEYAEMFLLRMAGLIENEGYDACVQRNTSNIRIKGDKTQNPELFDTYELRYAAPVSPDKPVPDVIIDFPNAARICGLGSVSVKGNVLTRKFGPYVRFAFLITDAPLECDAPFEENLCDGCMECAKVCPGHAIDANGLDSWQCSVYYRGAHKSNPYMRDEILLDEPDRESILEGEKRFDAVSARKIYRKLDFLPYSINGYVGCMCAKACDRACYEHLERSGLICRI
ncbi:MAG: 4Fe-4S binding protein [Clostridia bacterium]|nr:4Fe-4S binding protein [Clostridia bacterium]